MYFTAIDIGTKNVKAIVCEAKKSGRISILKSLKTSSEGVRKGEIVHPDEAIVPLLTVLKAIARDDKKLLKNLSFSISSPKSSFYTASSAVSIPRSDQAILREDLDRAVNEAINISKKVGWNIIHSGLQEFSVDSIPVGNVFIEGLSGRKLEVEVAVVSIFESVYKNLDKLVKLVLGKKSNFDGASLFFAPFASDRAVLSTKQRDLGSVLLDIGGGTIGVVVYRDGKIVYSSIFPFGSDNITNDIVAGLKCDFSVANKIKEKFGVAYSKRVPSKEKIEISQFDDSDDRTISKKYISEIIEARVREMFKVIGDELSSVGISENLPAGAVITGGGAKMPGILEVAREELKLPVQVGIPNLSVFEAMNSKLVSEIGDPEMSVSVGMILSRLEIEGVLNKTGTPVDISDYGGRNNAWEKFKDFIKMFTTGG